MTQEGRDPGCSLRWFGPVPSRDQEERNLKDSIIGACLLAIPAKRSCWAHSICSYTWLSWSLAGGWSFMPLPAAPTSCFLFYLPLSHKAQKLQLSTNQGMFLGYSHVAPMAASSHIPCQSDGEGGARSINIQQVWTKADKNKPFIPIRYTWRTI